MIVDESFNADKLVKFLETLVKDAERKDQIEIFYLPSYSPEINPDEPLNTDLKYAIGSKVAPRNKTRV